jgi:hypothetical protein
MNDWFPRVRSFVNVVSEPPLKTVLADDPVVRFDVSRDFLRINPAYAIETF